ncbi:MAG: tRNA lysidine(34) synthetase TilS [Rubrivivax sp.]
MPFAVAVAASGGRDSTALLHATAVAARRHGGEVHALHVHHGLVADADEWLVRLREQCRRWRRSGLPVEFHATRLEGRPARGESVEAWARRGRYRALAAMAREAGCAMVLLAQHRRDQAETLLLQALRGGGPAGLAGMPAVAEREGLLWLRPWLYLPREAVEDYVRRHRLRYSDDASNADPRYARNRLRAQVWPALARAFGDAEPQLAAAAQRAAEAAAALSELAALDAGRCVVEGTLLRDEWLRLSEARRTLLLRHWLHGVAGDAPESLVERLAGELPSVRQGRWPAPGGECRLYRGGLGYARVLDPAGVPPAATQPMTMDLSRPGRHAVAPWQGHFVVRRCRAGGIAAERLRRAELRPRAGGESFQLEPGAMARSLKKQYQARGVPAWRRGGPLLFDGGLLLYAPALGIDARARAPAGEPQLQVEWEPGSGR